MLDVLAEALWGTGCGGGRGMHMCLCPGTFPSFPKYKIGCQLTFHSHLY